MRYLIVGNLNIINAPFILKLLSHDDNNELFIANNTPPVFLKNKNSSNLIINTAISEGRFHFINFDIRITSNISALPKKIDVICNFFFPNKNVIPKHQYELYLLGSKTICEYAIQINCMNMLAFSPADVCSFEQADFIEKQTSSATSFRAALCIAVENNLKEWQKKTKNKLIIARVAEFFGVGSRHTFCRSLKFFKWHFYFFQDNKNTRKSKIYIPELCNMLLWALKIKTDNNIILFNAAYPNTMQYKDFIRYMHNHLYNKKPYKFVNIPYKKYIYFLELINHFFLNFGIINLFSTSSKKQIYQNLVVVPKFLSEHHYEWLFDEEGALKYWLTEEDLTLIR